MKSFILSYLKDIQSIVNHLDTENIEKAIRLLSDAKYKDKQIFVIGNGGSAATANHFVCDLGKNTVRNGSGRFRIISLCDNISYITAYGNDIGYENVFIEQLKNLLRPGDIVVAISGSGESPNIIQAADYAQKKGGKVIGLTGCNGGRLKEKSDVNINVASNQMEKIEDAHMIVQHIFVSTFKQDNMYK